MRTTCIKRHWERFLWYQVLLIESECIVPDVQDNTEGCRYSILQNTALRPNFYLAAFGDVPLHKIYLFSSNFLWTKLRPMFCWAINWLHRMCFHFRNSLPLWAIFIYNILIYLPPANEVCEGYVFAGVCLSTRGSLSGRPPRTVTCGRYASYWNAFLSQLFWVGSLWCQNWNQPYWYSSTRFISITSEKIDKMWGVKGVAFYVWSWGMGCLPFQYTVIDTQFFVGSWTLSIYFFVNLKYEKKNDKKYNY